MNAKRLNVSSDRAAFANIDEFCQTEIIPYLNQKETRRKRAVTQFVIVIGITFLIAVSLFFLAPVGGGNIQAAFLAVFAGSGIAAWLLKRASNDISHGLLSRISNFFGFAYQQDLPPPSYVQAFQTLKILPQYDVANFEDEICGDHEGTTFTLCEAHLKRQSNGKNRTLKTVFHGQLLVIDYHKKFSGKTVLLRDAGLLNRFGRPGKGFQQVGLASPVFEKIFEAWSTDQVEARDVLDPIVLERFQELERLFSGGKLSAAFVGGQVMISLNVGDKLNMGSMFQPLATLERVEKILAEFDLIFDLVDVLTKRIDGRLEGSFNVKSVRK